MRSAIGSSLGWLAPSAAAACAGGLAAGFVEGAWCGERVVAAAGFVALIGLPGLLVASVIVRGLHAGWQPAELGLVEDGGGMPRLAGWIAMVGLGALALAWAAFQGTWLLASWTAFKPLSIGFAAPILVVGAALVLVSVSRPIARLFTSLARRIDRRWRARGWRTLLTPRKIVTVAAVVAILAGYLVWRILVGPRLGPIHTTPAHAPLAGILAVLVVHALWSMFGRAQRLIVASLIALAAVAIAGAFVAQVRAPRLTLEIWGRQPIARLTIEALFDTGEIRDRISLADVRPVELPGAGHPDIVLIVIESLRADRTPPYGGPAEMPVLRELATRGSVFTWAFAPSSDAPRSLASMMIGVSPDRVRGDLVGEPRIDPRHVVVAARLRGAGYETAGFMCCAVWRGLGHGLGHVVIEPIGAKLGFVARTWIEQREQATIRRPLFLTLHVGAPPEWTSALSEMATDAELRRAYDASLAAADAIVKDVLAGFSRSVPITIITSAHGEGLGDHDRQAHGSDLYNSQLRVPLVIAGPGMAAQQIGETVSLTDLVPTILELAGFRPPRDRSLDGRSLADLAAGRRPSTPDAGTAFAMMPGDGKSPAASAVILGRHKLIHHGTTAELYDLQVDPDERSNLISARRHVAIKLRGLLGARHARAFESPF